MNRVLVLILLTAVYYSGFAQINLPECWTSVSPGDLSSETREKFEELKHTESGSRLRLVIINNDTCLPGNKYWSQALKTYCPGSTICRILTGPINPERLMFPPLRNPKRGAEDERIFSPGAAF